MVRNLIQEERERYVRKYIPELFTNKYKSVLYVGANQKRQHFLDSFENANYDRIVIIEIFPDNVKFLKEKLNDSKIHRVIEGDITKIEEYDLSKFDIVFFWHGIGHLHKKHIKSTLKKLESIANHIIILGTPYGKYILKEGEKGYGNPFEQVLTIIYPNVLEELGYKTETLGKQDERGSNITAWKYLD